MCDEGLSITPRLEDRVRLAVQRLGIVNVSCLTTHLSRREGESIVGQFIIIEPGQSSPLRDKGGVLARGFVSFHLGHLMEPDNKG